MDIETKVKTILRAKGVIDAATFYPIKFPDPFMRDPEALAALLKVEEAIRASYVRHPAEKYFDE